jgi:hypothetical protein
MTQFLMHVSYVRKGQEVLDGTRAALAGPAPEEDR